LNFIAGFTPMAPRDSRAIVPAPLSRLFVAVFLATAVLLAAGCVPREDRQIRLRAAFWSPPGIEEEIARRFEATHPGVKVDLLITGGRYAEKLQAMIVAGNEPDILMAQDTFFHDWAARGVFLDLTDLVREMNAADPIMPAPLAAFTWQGRNYVVPTDCNAMVAYGNLDAATAAGLTFPWPAFTWEQLEALGPKLSRSANPDSPTEFLCSLPQEWFFFVAYGARCLDDPWKPTRIVVDAPVTYSAVDYWRRMHQRGWAVPRSTVLDQGESEMFRDGRIAFLFWGRGSSKFVRTNPALKWDIAPVPTGPENHGVPHLSVAVGISRRSQHVALAREFLRFYVSDRAAEVPVKAGQIVPVRRRQAYGGFFLNEHPPASMLEYVKPMEAGGLTAIAYCPGRLELEEIVRKRFEQSLAEPDVPTREIVHGLDADVRAWFARQKEKGFL
jgi:multiple sugar transport system substrate-binding protein